jgi:hypothetical protein
LVELEAIAQEEREWEAMLDSPEGQEALERLTAQARQEMAEGKTYDIDVIL